MNKKIIIVLAALIITLSFFVNEVCKDLDRIFTKENIIMMGKEIKDIKEQIEQEE